MNSDSSIRNVIAKSLGALWILDGLLQFQPQMFGANFVNAVLVPSLSDQPSSTHAIVAFGIMLWNINPPLMDTLAALLQIGIGVLLFFPLSSRAFKAGAYVSIVWGIIVWLCGEGAGLLLTGSATFYTGAPGAVLFYSIPAALLLMGQRAKVGWFPKIVGWTFLVGAALQLQSAFWNVDGIQGSMMASMMEPFHALKLFPTYVANILSINPVIGNALLVLIPLVIGLLILLRPNRANAAVALAFLLLVWWWGQDFGALTTLGAGTATDPNTAPLLALLLIPLFLKQGMTAPVHSDLFRGG